MPVYVEMVVRPPDPAKFEAAAKESIGEKPDGLIEQWFGRLESDPGLYAFGGVWQSHDAMHAYSEKIGDEFNAKAGTEGVEWETKVWEIMS